MSKLEDFLTTLSINASRTSGARFNAARRLEKRDWFSTFSIAMFSVVSVGIAVVGKVYAFQPGSHVDNYLTALSVSIGLIVIVISLIEWGMKAQLNAGTLQRNAEDLVYFKTKLDQLIAESQDGTTLSHEDTVQLREEYKIIKAMCPINHEPVDYELYRVQNRARSEFLDQDGKPRIGLFQAFWVRLDSLLSAVGYLLVFWLVIIALIGVAALKY